MAQDYTVKVFDQFYNLNIVVNANEYDVVYSYFRGYLSNDKTAKTFTDILFRISNITQIPVMDLLQSFQAGSAPDISRTLAYYLNSVGNKFVLYGVNNTVAPNSKVARNIIYDNLS